MFKKKLNFDALPVVQNKIRFYLYKGVKYKWNSINFPTKQASENAYAAAGFRVNTSNICFSSFNRQLNGTEKDCNRVVFLFEKSKCITTKEQRKWLLLCKKHKFLPRYASVTNVMKHQALVLDVSEHSRNLMYIYLTVSRWPQEDPCMVRNTLCLVEKFGMDFFVAITFATQIRMNNMNHHFLPGNALYMKPATVDHITSTRVDYMIGLYRFIQKEGPQSGSKDRFNANTSVENQCSISMEIKAKDLLNPALVEIVRAKTDKEAEKLLKEAGLGG